MRIRDDLSPTGGTVGGEPRQPLHDAGSSNAFGNRAKRAGTARPFGPLLRPLLVMAALALVLLVVSLACNLPIVDETPVPPTLAPGASPTPPPTPTPQQPVPPTLVEIDPPPGARVPLNGPLTLYFSHPMNHRSVEAGLRGDPPLSGRLVWEDDATLKFFPDAPFPPAIDFSIELGTGAQAENGLSLLEPIRVDYRTAGRLEITQMLPAPETEAVDPSAAIVVSFNRPVVPLGADPESVAPAFRLEPEAPGQGAWINTSTYQFRADPALEGGRRYAVFLHPDLESTEGGPLAARTDAPAWAFSTALPELIDLDPVAGDQNVPLDAAFTLTFNQPMQAASVAAAFRLAPAGGEPVSGSFQWDERFTELTFRPDDRLDRNRLYALSLDAGARARGGTPLSVPVQASFRTVPELNVVSTDPAPGGTLPAYSSVEIVLSAPLASGNLDRNLSFTPALAEAGSSYDLQSGTLRVFGRFEPDTTYELSLSEELSDPWGGALGRPFTLPFRTASLPPALNVAAGQLVLYVPTEDPTVVLQATNVDAVEVTLARLSRDDFFRMNGPGGYEVLQSYQPAGAVRWEEPLRLPENQSQEAGISLSGHGLTLEPGVYYLDLSASGLPYDPPPRLLVISGLHVTVKWSPTEALVWAVDLDGFAPVSDAVVSLYDENGAIVSTGETDREGLFQTGIPTRDDSFGALYAVLETPGNGRFGLARASWDQGVSAWDFGLPVDYTPPGPRAYLYTDRPIYRPGQTVHYRAVVRQSYNGRYALPEMDEVQVAVLDGAGRELETQTLPVSPWGTAHGEFEIPSGSDPGIYRLDTGIGDVPFTVAEYRKPEIDLEVELSPEIVQAGQDLEARVLARYFTGQPAGSVEVAWTMYSRPESGVLPGYRVGLPDERWMALHPGIAGSAFGEFIASGEGRTDSAGRLSVRVPAQMVPEPSRITVEVTVTDEAGFSVAARATGVIHPGPVVVGVRPLAWVGRTGEPIEFAALIVDWDGKPVGGLEGEAKFQKVVWERVDARGRDPFQAPEYIPQYTLIETVEFETDLEGSVVLSFVPDEPGTYQLEVAARGARSGAQVWVGGPGQAVWPALPNQRLLLTADQETYLPGEEARIFIPNPFGVAGPALVTVERDVLVGQEVIELGPVGQTYVLPLTETHSPNVYVSVVLLGRQEGGRPDFRAGYVSVRVETRAQILNASLTGPVQSTAPGEEVTLELQVTDSRGAPIQGEFSVAVVDLATLALREPNAPGIVTAFYAPQPLGMRTGLSLAVYAQRQFQAPPGQGGGGGQAEGVFVREDFQDTAYWNPSVLTDEEGRATVTLRLPDNLTTWQAEVRGVTDGTRVGEGETTITATKPLLVRPVTPRFVVVGDRLALSAVVHNNTDRNIAAQVSLDTEGFSLDDPGEAARNLTVPARERVRVEWWGRVQDVDSLDLQFSVQGGGLSDSVRVMEGELPVHRYASPQSYATRGTLAERDERLEVIGAPRSFEPVGGSLSLELSPSLAAEVVAALETLGEVPYESPEITLSRFWPTLELYRALDALGLEVPGLRNRLTGMVQEGVAALSESQNPDGGWGWGPGSQVDNPVSDPYLSAYLLYGLSRARAGGVRVPARVIDGAIAFLRASLPAPAMLSEPWQLDRLAFQHLALLEAGAGDLAGVSALYQERERLNPWAQAMVAMTLSALAPDDARAETLVSDLQSTAVRTGTGAHWPVIYPGPQNLSTPMFNTAVVVWALAERDPAAPLVAEAARYLTAQRSATGTWGSTYETAWLGKAISAYLLGTGELAGDYAYAVALNGTPLAEGDADPSLPLTPVQVTVPWEELRPDGANLLQIERGPGAGRLHYRAYLRVDQPVESAAPLDRGIRVSRAYAPVEDGCREGPCVPIRAAPAGTQVQVRLSVVLEEDAYHLVVEDFLPAGAEVVDPTLRTQPAGPTDQPPLPRYDLRSPYAAGWGWWLFSAPRIYDERVVWRAEFLPAGTYELTYTLSLLLPGDYRVIPARAWQLYFPEVQGTSAGEVFAIEPSP